MTCVVYDRAGAVVIYTASEENAEYLSLVYDGWFEFVY